MNPKDSGGAVTVMVVIMLPLFLLSLALVLDVGLLFITRTQAQAAVDMGALAGVQELDWDAAARGVLQLRPEEAERSAKEWTLRNLEALRRARPGPGDVFIKVEVYNASPDQPMTVRGTGRVISTPTVRVEAKIPTTLLLLSLPVELKVAADASVVRSETR